MTITAWRIVQARFVTGAFSGESARRFGGRWNSEGTPLIYTAGSQALAALEMLVHLDSNDLLKQYRLIAVTFDAEMITAVNPRQLPVTWRRRPTPLAARVIGDDWAASLRSVVLRLPSVIVPGESNFLLNPLHPGFRKVKIGDPQPFRFDRRLM